MTSPFQMQNTSVQIFRHVTGFFFISRSRFFFFFLSTQIFSDKLHQVQRAHTYYQRKHTAKTTMYDTFTSEWHRLCDNDKKKENNFPRRLRIFYNHIDVSRLLCHVIPMPCSPTHFAVLSVHWFRHAFRLLHWAAPPRLHHHPPPLSWMPRPPLLNAVRNYESSSWQQ